MSNKLYNKYWVKYAGICGTDINKAKEKCISEGNVLNFGHEVVCASSDGEMYVVNPFICDSVCKTCELSSYIYCDKVNRLGCGNMSGGYSGEITIPQKNLYKIPQCSHPEVGVLCDGIAVVLHGFHMVKLHNINKLAIIGAGSIGILSALIAKEKFPQLSIDIFTKTKEKKTFLNNLFGASFNYIDINNLATKANHYDVVIEAVGGPQTKSITNSIEIVKNNGTIIVFGAFGENSTNLIGLRNLFYKQISMVGVNSFCKIKDDFSKAVKWAFEHEEKLSQLLTNIYYLKRNQIDPKMAYQFLLEYKKLKGYIVYE